MTQLQIFDPGNGDIPCYNDQMTLLETVMWKPSHNG